MDAIFYTFTKRVNSLAVPTTAGERMEVMLKSNVNMDSPTLIIYRDSFPFNYFKFDGKYFWVTNIISVGNDIWQVESDIDYLASYRAEILNTTAFVSYDTTVNKVLPDRRIPAKVTPSVRASYGSLSDKLSEIGTYVLSVVGESGSVASYALSLSYLNRILDSVNEWVDELYHDINSEDGIVDVLKRTGKQLVSVGNAGECIRSCIWIPWRVDTVLDGRITLGRYDTGIGGNKIDTPIFISSGAVTIPWQFSDWRNSEPYTQVYVYIPFVGLINIPASNVMGIGAIDFYVSVDALSGHMSVKLQVGNEVLGTYGGNTAVSVPIGVSNVSPMSVVNGVTGAVASVATGNIAGTLLAGAQMLTPNMTTVGGLGGGSAIGLGTDVACITVCHDTISSPDSYNTIMGTPAMLIKQLKNLTGYVQTNMFSVSLNAERSIIERINTAMDGGVYIE